MASHPGLRLRAARPWPSPPPVPPTHCPQGTQWILSYPAYAQCRPCLESTPTRTWVAKLAVNVYNAGRTRITYSQPSRWSGIRNYVCPAIVNGKPNVPPTEDCSSFVTWL